MPVKTIVQKAKASLLEGQTAEALDPLIAFLERDEKYEQLLRMAINIRSEYSRLQDEQNQGFISSDEANARLNRLNARLLDLLDRLADGRLKVESTPTAQGGQRKKMLFIGIPVLLLIGAYLGYRFWPSPPTDGEKISCPDFAPKADMRVLLLPFKSISGDELKAEYTVKQRLDDLAYEKDLPVQVQIFERFYERPNANFPGFRQAEKIGRHCNADLILWGTAEETPDKRIILTSKFKFLGDEQAFQVKQLELEGETDLVAVNSISSLLQEGTFTQDVETLILTFYGLMAHQEGQYAEAAEALEEVVKRDSIANPAVHSLLADSYLSMNEPLKAIQHYEIVAELKPTDTLTLRNLAWMQIMNDRPQDALETAKKLIEAAPESSDGFNIRAYAYVALKEYDLAAMDFKRAKIFQTHREERIANEDNASENKAEEETHVIRPDTSQIRPKSPDYLPEVSISPEDMKKIKRKKKPRLILKKELLENKTNGH